MKTSTVINALNLSQNADARIQDAFLGLMPQLVDMSKRDICESDKLAAVFSHPQMGRKSFKQVLTWITEFTPLRPKFKDNGHFDKLGFAKKPVWNIEGMTAAKWWDHEATKTTKAAKSSFERGLAALVREVARESFETGAPGACVDKAREIVTNKMMALVIEEMQTEKFNEWATARKADIDAAARKEQQADAEKSAEVLAMVASARANMAKTEETTVVH